MATTHYIDTSAPEIARARVKSLTQRVPEAFPVLVYGDTRDHNFVFFNSQTGSVESYSGNASYSLRVTLGEVQLGPTSGSYILTCGSSATLNALSDASTVEAALNVLTTIISDGGVKVSGTFPNFLVTYNTVGVKTAFTADATSLVPASSVSLVVTATGSASVRQQTMIILRQSAIVSQSTWSTITSPANGWTGTITTATAGALTLLAAIGQQVGEFIECSTCLTAEVLDGSGTPISYYQTPITLRAKNLDPSSSVSPPLTTYTLGDILYGKADGTLGRLAGNTSTTPAILTQTGTGVVSAIPAWTVTPLSVALGGTGAATLTSTALLLGAGTSAITPADLTYASPTLSVPDAFVVSSAGSIGLTAGGAAKNITLTPSTTGAVSIPITNAANSSITGSLIIGTGTAATSTGIGSGSINTGTNISLGGVLLFTGATSSITSAAGTPLTLASGGGGAAGTGNIKLTPSGDDDVVINSVTHASDFLRLSVDRIPGNPSIWLKDAGSPSTSNYAVGGNATTTNVNAATTLNLRNSNSTIVTVTSANVNFPGTVSASSATTGAVTIGNGTAATNVGIGGGNINAGGTIKSGGILTANTATIDGSAATVFTGGAGNMTITAGTGASRTLTLQTTTSGSAATTALTLGADQSALFAGVAAFAGAAISSTSGAVFPVGTTALSSLRIPHGAAPTSPVNGDMWTTTAGLFVRINGATVGPLS